MTSVQIRQKLKSYIQNLLTTTYHRSNSLIKSFNPNLILYQIKELKKYLNLAVTHLIVWIRIVIKWFEKCSEKYCYFNYKCKKT